MTTNDDAGRSRRFSRAASEGNWFFVVAGLALLNALLPWLGLPVFFVAALAAPLIVSNRAHLVSSGLTLAQADAAGYAALALCVLVFAVLGFFARKGHAWAFAAGGALYLADGLAFLYYRDYISFGLHLFVLYFIISGLIGVLRSRRYAPAAVTASPIPAVARSAAPPRDDKPARPGSLYPR